MSKKTQYKPPKVWKWDDQDGGQWSKTNRPIAGATHKKKLPSGKHPIQLHSLATPNGQKVTIMLEELLELGVKGAQYDAYKIDIGKGEQFGSGFVDINPNSKIPAMLDRSTKTPTRVFESGAILLYLAEKFDALMPKDNKNRPECLSWLFWQMGSAPYLGGGFGHFYKYAPYPIEYCIDRFTMETKRQLDVLDRHLAKNKYLCGNEYTIADIAIWPWYGQVVLDIVYEAAEFLDAKRYKHVIRWAKAIAKRPAVIRGCMVNRPSGPEDKQVVERHSDADFSGKATGSQKKTQKKTKKKTKKKGKAGKKASTKKTKSNKTINKKKSKKKASGKKKATSKKKKASDKASNKKTAAKKPLNSRKKVSEKGKATSNKKISSKKKTAAKKKK